MTNRDLSESGRSVVYGHDLSENIVVKTLPIGDVEAGALTAYHQPPPGAGRNRIHPEAVKCQALTPSPQYHRSSQGAKDTID